MTQMVLAVPKHQQTTNMIMLDNSYYYNFPILSIPRKFFPLADILVSLVLTMAHMVLAV